MLNSPFTASYLMSRLNRPPTRPRTTSVNISSELHGGLSRKSWMRTKHNERPAGVVRPWLPRRLIAGSTPWRDETWRDETGQNRVPVRREGAWEYETIEFRYPARQDGRGTCTSVVITGILSARSSAIRPAAILSGVKFCRCSITSERLPKSATANLE